MKPFQNREQPGKRGKKKKGGSLISFIYSASIISIMPRKQRGGGKRQKRKKRKKKREGKKKKRGEGEGVVLFQIRAAALLINVLLQIFSWKERKRRKFGKGKKGKKKKGEEGREKNRYRWVADPSFGVFLGQAARVESGGKRGREYGGRERKKKKKKRERGGGERKRVFDGGLIVSANCPASCTKRRCREGKKKVLEKRKEN